MKIVITGASGFIGTALSAELARQNHTLVLLSRNPPARPSGVGVAWLAWRPDAPGSWQSALDGIDGVVNLAGESIAARRWTQEQKRKLYESRVQTTSMIVDGIAKARRKPKFLINASAVGYYGPHGDETVTEDSPPGNDFLSQLCRAWESQANRAKEHDVRVTLLRTGIVLGKGQGALGKMVTPFKLFVGGRLGSGRQWFPWIHIDDEVGLIKFLMENDAAHGPINATAPNPVTMDEFCKTLGRVINRPSWAPVPASVLSLMLGEMADMLLTGQRALPQAALRLGYPFKYPRLEEALASLHL
jgi:uncharacterized protein (TIGR01777 family)